MARDIACRSSTRSYVGTAAQSTIPRPPKPLAGEDMAASREYPEQRPRNPDLLRRRQLELRPLADDLNDARMREAGGQG